MITAAGDIKLIDKYFSQLITKYARIRYKRCHNFLEDLSKYIS